MTPSPGDHFGHSGSTVSGPDDRRADERFVRPFALTGGRTRPTRPDLDLTTQVVVSPEPRRREFLPPELRGILLACTRPVAVPELAAAVSLPFITVMVLVSDLIDRGHLVRDATLWPTEDMQSMTFLGRVLDGLERAL